MALILGSTSSARAELLKKLGLDFKIIAPSFDERSIPLSDDPISYCRLLSLKKNESILKDPNDVVITCDTIVALGSLILNKPQDYHEAMNMIQMLSGKTHIVISALTLAHRNELIQNHEITEVTFHSLNTSQIETFLQDPHFIHRSGAYTLTGKGGLIVKSIQGSYENVIGLPFNTLENLLSKWDLSLWDLGS